MHLHIIIAFALLIWCPRERPFAPLVQSPAAVCLTVAALLILVIVLARLVCLTSLARLQKGAAGTGRRHRRHQRLLAMLHALNLLAFAAELIVTRWPELIKATPVNAVPGLADVIIMSPYLLASVLILALAYPVDRALRERVAASLVTHGLKPHGVWSLRSYLNFNIRHQMLMVLVPLTLILIVHDATRRFELDIEAATGMPWSADLALGTAAGMVFVIGPWMLKHIWTTHSLPAGPLRNELQSFCRRIGLNCRDILVWRSDGMIVNAAVMGIAGPLRYVLLSDGLIQAMSPKQIEAVFGHEAGHVRHKHIQFFLLFAVASMLVASGIMELLFHLWRPASLSEQGHEFAIQLAGLMSIGLIWGLGFGFISRRFERQADLFGARCVGAQGELECSLPCGVHAGRPNAEGDAQPGLCATGAQVFASALRHVATLNGLPQKEFSWRHASIADRIESLNALAGDPNRLAAFERVIRRIKAMLLAICVGGLVISAVYVGPFLIDAWSRNR